MFNPIWTKMLLDSIPFEFLPKSLLIKELQLLITDYLVMPKEDLVWDFHPGTSFNLFVPNKSGVALNARSKRKKVQAPIAYFAYMSVKTWSEGMGLRFVGPDCSRQVSNWRLQFASTYPAPVRVLEPSQQWSPPTQEDINRHKCDGPLRVMRPHYHPNKNGRSICARESRDTLHIICEQCPQFWCNSSEQSCEHFSFMLGYWGQTRVKSFVEMQRFLSMKNRTKDDDYIILVFN